MRLMRPAVVALSLLLGVGVAQSAAAKPKPSADQLSFGVQMARRGLWNEAFFRFEQAARLEPSNPRILNNLAVASEARGKFDEALKYYQDALRVASTDAEIKRNYARFVEFYQSFKSANENAETPATEPVTAEPEKSGNGDG